MGGGRLDEALGLLLVAQEGLDFAAQLLVVRASRGEKCGALLWLALQRLVIQLLDLSQSIFVHVNPYRCISRSNHTLANFQSRRTVSGETLSAAAVSSTLRPPKNRISTTSPFLRSTADSAFNASSNATSSALRS